MVGSLQSYVEYFENKEEISAINKDAVKWFLEECAVEGLSQVSQQKYVFGFTALLTKFIPHEVDLNKATIQQLKQIVDKIHGSEYENSTQCFLKQCLKKFYKYKCNGVFPKKVAFIKTTEKKKIIVRREDLKFTKWIQGFILVIVFGYGAFLDVPFLWRENEPEPDLFKSLLENIRKLLNNIKLIERFHFIMDEVVEFAEGNNVLDREARTLYLHAKLAEYASHLGMTQQDLLSKLEQRIENETALQNGVGKYLQQLRKQSSLTQSQLAERLGTTRGYINNVENNYSSPSFKFISQYLSAID